MAMGTLPGPHSDRWMARNGESDQLRRYVRLNPNWEQGYALPLLTRVRPLAVAAGVVRYALPRLPQLQHRL